MRIHHLVQIVSRLSRSLRETLNGEPRSARSVPARYLLPLAASPQETSHFELCNAYPLVPTVSRLSGLCLAFLLLGAHPGLAQRTLPDYSGITAGDRVRVTLKDGVSIDGHLMRMTDSTLVLSATKAPIAVLQLRSLPLEVSQVSVTMVLSDGSRVTGQVTGLTEQRLVFRKEGAIGNAFIDRSAVVVVSNRGRKAGESAVDLRHGEIALITKLTSYVNGAVTTRFLRDGEQPHQLALALAPGVRVRLTAPTIGEEAVVGTVVSVDSGGVIVLRPSTRVDREPEGDPQRIPWTAVTGIDVYKGRKTNGWKAAGYGAGGALSGAVVGAIVGTVYMLTQVRESSDEALALSVLVGSAYGGGHGAVIGLLIGGVIGAWPRDKWQTVPLSRLQIGLNRPRRDRFESKPEGMALNVSFKF